jgi:hypothetical protein
MTSLAIELERKERLHTSRRPPADPLGDHMSAKARGLFEASERGGEGIIAKKARP